MKLIVSIRFLAYIVYLFHSSANRKWCFIPHDVPYYARHLLIPLFGFWFSEGYTSLSIYVDLTP
jgi:hypothetical protein